MKIKYFSIVIGILLLLHSDVSLAQTAEGNSNKGKLPFIPNKPKEVKSSKDIIPPSIEIIEPGGIGMRGMKIVSDTMVVKTAELNIRGIVKDSGGVAIVYVNGSEASMRPVKGGCEFTSNQLLQFGINRIEISAVDVSKNMSMQTLTIRRDVVAPAVTEKKLPIEPFKGNQVWAVVIGISDYQSSEIQKLRYADKDAEAFYQYLITPLEKGGRGVSQVNIRKLINKEATKINIQEAIFDFMKNPLEEDVVMLFFAGHGAPDPYRPNVPYLLAYDSDLSRPAATAVKMQDIQDAIRDYIKSKKIIVFADACHSAGISETFARRGLENIELINTFLADIKNADNSVLTFSASEAKESSMEGQQWGGGHGVFTYHLLEGLGGKADVDSDGIIRLGELVDYVSINVRRDTKSLQHPTRVRQVGTVICRCRFE